MRGWIIARMVAFRLPLMRAEIESNQVVGDLERLASACAKLLARWSAVSTPNSVENVLCGNQPVHRHIEPCSTGFNERPAATPTGHPEFRLNLRHGLGRRRSHTFLPDRADGR